jgi:uncharacterized protein
MKQKLSTLLLLILIVLTITIGHSMSFAQIKSNKAAKAKKTLINGERLILTQKGSVNDFANVLNRETETELEQMLRSFKEKAKIDFAIMIVKTTGNKTAFDYSLSVANHWEAGTKNPDKSGILMLIAIEDRKWHIQISRSLEKALSDSEVSEFGDLMGPFFKEQKYNEGITKSVVKFIKVLKERRGVK